MRLFRALGLAELQAVAANEFKGFPPQQRHASFSPSVDLEYTRQIARDWVAADERAGFLGFVTHFDVSDAFMGGIAVQGSGPTCHREIWIPPEREDEFNLHLQAPIRVIETFVGVRFEGDVERITGLRLDQLGRVDG